MATADEIRVVLRNLRDYYRDKDQQPRALSEFQIAVYLDGLGEFTAEQLAHAARQWMRESKWFPALSDLRGLLVKPMDWQTAALMAWTTFERAIRQAGIYRGVTFADTAIGEAVRQTFGSWECACSFDRDSPGWTIRRQTFLGLFQHIAQNLHHDGPVTLHGLGQADRPLLIESVAGLPNVAALPAMSDQTKDMLATVSRMFKESRQRAES